MATKRITKELQDLQKTPIDWLSAGPSGDNLFRWNVTIIGPDETAYQGGVFHLEVEFPQDYPFKAPRIKFTTRIYHPNIKRDTGEICTEFLQDTWAPTLRLVSVAENLRQLLREPNLDSPLEPDIGREYSERKSTFVEKARKHTLDYATA